MDFIVSILASIIAALISHIIYQGVRSRRGESLRSDLFLRLCELNPGDRLGLKFTSSDSAQDIRVKSRLYYSQNPEFGEAIRDLEHLDKTGRLRRPRVLRRWRRDRRRKNRSM